MWGMWKHIQESFCPKISSICTRRNNILTTWLKCYWTFLLSIFEVILRQPVISRESWHSIVTQLSPACCIMFICENLLVWAKCMRCLRHCRQIIVASINSIFLLFLSFLIWSSYFSPRGRFPRVLKLCMGF